MKLVVITGPIASGKTSVGQGLATAARERGLRAAAIDLDVFVFMVMGRDWSRVQAEHWNDALELATAALERLQSLGYYLVALSGPFFNADFRLRMLEAVPPGVSVILGLLRVSLEESVRRTGADATRGAYVRDPAFVERIYGTIEWESLPSFDFDIDTDERTLDEVVALVAAKVLP